MEVNPGMEEALSLILRGCSLARDFESNPLNFRNNINFLARFCDEILGVFSAAKERLSRPQHECLRTSTSQSMDLPRIQMRPPPFDDSGNLPAMGFGSSSYSSTSTKARRRKDGMAKRTVRVAAPRIGNTELPPDDGFTWRKYGQKEILGSRFPRGYFRCTHQKLYHCPAKKHVQRLDHDPHTFEVAYLGDHTCHMSATAPSAPPPPSPLPEVAGLHMTQFPPPSAGWLSMEYGGPATIRSSKDVGDQFPVLDMVDAMFNSGTGSSNSVDSIFGANVGEEEHQHHKWEKDNTKN
ncbi:WRKY transcription factor 55 [Cucurbita moschata]|uniref:WRKY transcription factor 55 n=1 Tax=Cucurbita moschata TaxID=3662 RepID=A0A6J1FNE7_CUCMO|nr:WRKY transcription factor 55 [Cucurbita moschata]